MDVAALLFYAFICLSPNHDIIGQHYPSRFRVADIELQADGYILTRLLIWRELPRQMAVAISAANVLLLESGGPPGLCSPHLVNAIDALC